jgi:hypothetical protein
MLLSQRMCPTASSAGSSLYRQCSTCLSGCTCTYQQSVLQHADKALPTQPHGSMQMDIGAIQQLFANIKTKRQCSHCCDANNNSKALLCYHVSVEHIPANEICQLSPGGGFVGCYPTQFLFCSCFQALLPDTHIRWLAFNHSNICIVLKPSHTCKDMQLEHAILTFAATEL